MTESENKEKATEIVSQLNKNLKWIFPIGLPLLCALAVLFTWLYIKFDDIECLIVAIGLYICIPYMSYSCVMFYLKRGKHNPERQQKEYEAILDYTEATQKEEQSKIDPNDFVVKSNKDMKGTAWVLGIFMGGITILSLIGLPFIYASNRMRLTDLIIALSIFLVILIIIVWLMLRVLLFKVEIKNDGFYVRSLFRTRQYDITKLTTQAKASGHYKYFLVYHENKRVSKINYSMTGYEAVKKRLNVVDV